MKERRISFEGIRNCRDLGGLQSQDGRTVRSGLLLRSANLSGATAEDLRRLSGEYRMKAVIDLRTAMERRERPDLRADGAAYLPIPLFDERVFGISREEGTEAGGGPVKKQIPDMPSIYRMLVRDSDCRTNLGRAVRTIMEHDFDSGAVLWHCSEGKDRCGLVSAILLTSLSVDRETIAEDYLITNEVNAERARRKYREALEEGRGQAWADALYRAYIADRGFLDAAFREMGTDWSDAKHYLTEGLEIPLDTILRFRERMLD